MLEKYVKSHWNNYFWIRMLSRKIEFIEANELSEFYAWQAAQLAYLAYEEFYRIFSSSRQKILPIICKHFLSFSELNQVVAAVINGELSGIASYYQLSEMTIRQMADMHSLLEIVEDRQKSTNSLREFAINFSPPGDSGGYISRFAVAPEKRGSDLAMLLLKKVESVMWGSGLRQVRLHARQDNSRALAFYAKADYTPIGEENLGYVLLGKDLSSS